MNGSRRDRSTASYKKAEGKAYKIRLKVDAALEWLTKIEKCCEAGICDLSLSYLVTVGSQHLIPLENVKAMVPTMFNQMSRSPISRLREWLDHWRDGVAEAVEAGFDDGVSYETWQRDIERPEEFYKARKCFDTAQRVAEAPDQLGGERLENLVERGSRLIDAVEACEEFWPRARRVAIRRRILKWSALMFSWRKSSAEIMSQAALACAAAAGIDKAKRERRLLRLKQRKKRTCSQCGASAPLSSRALPYCGGCRSVPRVYRHRYCSEECQRAHWLAGHMHECPCEQDDDSSDDACVTPSFDSDDFLRYREPPTDSDG